MKKSIIQFGIAFIAVLMISSCDETFLETYPTDAVSAAAVTATTDNAWAALNGIHRALYVRYEMQGAGGLGGPYIVVDCQAEDHVNNASQWYGEVYQWMGPRTPLNRYCRYPWRMFYQWIANANVLINGIDDAVGPDAEKNAIKGQALFLRAFSHHRLVQAYADRYVPSATNNQLGIPLMLISTTEGQERATVEDVYTQINQDLDDAITLLAGFSRPDKSHINVDVAKGIKARVLLTQGRYSEAAAMAGQVIATGYPLMNFATYALGFRDGSSSNSEFLWASIIIPDQTDVWANFGAYMSRNFSSSAIRGNPRSISGWLYDQISTTDVRKTLWDPTGVHANLPPGITLLSTHKRFPYTNQKFIAPSNADSRVDVPHLRISEMYLIQAESYARIGGAANEALAAQALYTMAVVRDPSYTLSTNTGQALIDEIMIQRRVELWGEGFRWYDLKRLNEPLDRTQAGNHNSALALVMQVPAGDVTWTWLIPQVEIDANPNLVQNPLF